MNRGKLLKFVERVRDLLKQYLPEGEELAPIPVLFRQ